MRNHDFKFQQKNIFAQKWRRPCTPISTTKIIQFLKYPILISNLWSMLPFFKSYGFSDSLSATLATWPAAFGSSSVTLGQFMRFLFKSGLFRRKSTVFDTLYRTLSIWLSILFSIFLNLGHNDVIKPFSLIFLFLLVVFKLDRFL